MGRHSRRDLVGHLMCATDPTSSGEQPSTPRTRRIQHHVTQHRRTTRPRPAPTRCPRKRSILGDLTADFDFTHPPPPHTPARTPHHHAHRHTRQHRPQHRPAQRHRRLTDPRLPPTPNPLAPVGVPRGRRSAPGARGRRSNRRKWRIWLTSDDRAVRYSPGGRRSRRGLGRWPRGTPAPCRARQAPGRCWPGWGAGRAGVLALAFAGGDDQVRSDLVD